TSRIASRYAMRRVSTLVFPEPAPATTSNGEPACSTAARCAGLRSVNRSSCEYCEGEEKLAAPAAPAALPSPSAGHSKGVLIKHARYRVVSATHAVWHTGGDDAPRFPIFLRDPDSGSRDRVARAPHEASPGVRRTRGFRRSG